jgi:cytoskeletal protein CcmA (bactofilin family)
VVIGPSGSVTGEVICNADIEGKFNGTIQVAEVLNVKAKASNGVTVGKLSVGADFSASCIMKPNVKKLLLMEKNPNKKTSKWLAY